MNTLRSEIDEILSTSLGERELSAYIARNPQIIRGAVCRTWGHSAYVIKEFPLGSQYRADFVIATSYSGAWEVHLIELEPHDDNVITKDGLPSGKLNKALTQIADWKEYIEKNSLSFRSDLSDWCKKKDLLKIHNTKTDPTNYTGQLLKSMDTTIWFYYHIVIGKRENVLPVQRRRMNQITSAKLYTYGSLQDMADVLDLEAQALALRNQ